MQELAELREKIAHELLDLAKQSTHLGIGLENAAPAEKISGVNYSVQYLLNIGEYLAASRETMLSAPRGEWLSLLQNTFEEDRKQRNVHQIANKFHFIRQRIQALCDVAAETLAELQDEQVEEFHLAQDECMVYVYLYNATGADLQTWRKLLSQAVFYEHSINRPIYVDESAIRDYLRSKSHQLQHAYITVAINKADILSEVDFYHDVLGHKLCKIKEGALKMERFVSFTYNNHVYTLNPAGHLIKKEE